VANFKIAQNAEVGLAGGAEEVVMPACKLREL